MRAKVGACYHAPSRLAQRRSSGMQARMWVLMVGLSVAVLAAAAHTLTQNASPGGWLTPQWGQHACHGREPEAGAAADLTGTWIPSGRFGVGTQAGGVHQAKQRQAGESAALYSVRPGAVQVPQGTRGRRRGPARRGNDPRNCEPLGMPRTNHYNLNVTQIFQDEYKIAILYQYDNRWRVIWTDGRELPKLVDGGVEIGGEIREQRFFGYSVGRWVDDYTLEAQTVGTMPEDRVWLDATGRPISDQVRVTERFRRVDYDTVEWSETIDDPKVYTKPWETMRFPMRLHDPRTDVMEYYCSPVEQQNYNKFFGNGVSGK